MIPRFVCWLFGHKRRTVKKIYGVMSGRDIVTEHRRCPRCDTKLEE